ncbi:MAG: hypothetical protein HY710_07925 [Candidatus Latescibacteria bacterium]|nr:hypothetical protein [Candidatus Latescibacterota bacterium]
MFSFKTQQALAQPFPASAIKHRTQRWKDKKTGQWHTIQFDYVETATVIDRLNTLFGFEWTFTVQEHLRVEHEILVLGVMTVCGVTKTAFGGAVIGTGEEAVVNAYKAAVGDAIKLCAKQFGVGLHLWMTD